MKKFKLLALFTAIVCALSLVGLAACSSGGSGSASASASSSSSAPSDEELIRADVESVVGTVVTKEDLLKGMEADETIAQYKEYGMDIDKYAENLAKLFKVEVKDIKVNGDTAVATISLTVPEFGDKASAMVDEAIDKMEVDTSNVDATLAAYLNAVVDVMADPNFPTATTDYDLNYTKKDGTWTMDNKDTLQQSLDAVMKAAANPQAQS